MRFYIFFLISALCSLTDRPTDNYFKNERNVQCSEKIDFYPYQGPRKLRFYIFKYLLFVAWPTDRQTKYLD